MTPKMRDDTAPRKLVLAAINEYKEAYEDVSAKDLDQRTLRAYLSIARGLYTRGEPPIVCVAPAALAAKLYAEWVSCSQGLLAWSMEAELHNEFIGGAFLAGAANVVFEAWGESRWVDAPDDWELACLDLLCRAFGGRAPKAPEKRSGPPKIPGPMQPLVRMLQAIIENDKSKFAPALIAFLTKSVGPSAEKGAKAALRSHWPLYTGKWSLLAAAACRKMETIPEMSAKAQTYFPRELV
jgi:hypothetical protein